MKIFSIANNIYKQTYTPQKTNFCGGFEYRENKNQNQIDHKKSLEENLYDIYNTEYEPVDYEKYFPCEVEPEELPSQKYLKKSSSFRDEELFSNKTDIKYYYGPGKYDIDDIPVRQDLWMDIKNDYSKLYHCEMDTRTPCPKNDPYDPVSHPWMTIEKIADCEEEQKYKKEAAELIQQVENTDPDTINNIFKSTTLLTDGEMKINHFLCRLAIRLYKNSKQWTKTEKDIIKQLKTNFFQNYYTDFSKQKYKTVFNELLSEKSNEEILENLKMNESTNYDLGSIFTTKEIIDYFYKK